jgi:hypothetical protein
MIRLSDLWDDWVEFAQELEERTRSIRANQIHDDASMEDMLDDDTKLQRRLQGRNRYLGKSMMTALGRTDPNITVKVWDWRPMDDHFFYISEVDKQLGLCDYRDIPCSKRQTWDTVMDLFLSEVPTPTGQLTSQIAKGSIVANRRTNFQLTGKFLVSISDKLEWEKDASALQRKVKTWFRWGHRYYDPSHLYVISSWKHDKEIRFQVWKKQMGHGGFDRIPTCIAELCVLTKVLPRYQITWSGIKYVKEIRCRGERPEIKEFPTDYIQYEGKMINEKRPNFYWMKRARRRKTNKQTLSIVTNPNQLGFVKTFRISVFHKSTRRWICLGDFPANSEAKNWHTIDLSVYEIETNRIRIEPIDVQGNGRFELQVISHDTTVDFYDTENPAQKKIKYQVQLPTPPEKKHHMLKRGDKWASNVCPKYGGAKKLNSLRRGKLKQSMLRENLESYDHDE